MLQYHLLLDEILYNGKYKTDRTGTGTVSIFGYQSRYDLSIGFPLVTTKKVHLKSVIHELLWMLSGSTNVKELNKVGVTIWDEWANTSGELGPIYGKQWRSWQLPDSLYGRPSYIDQIVGVINQIREEPDSRRLVVSAWNAGEISQMALAPCHCLFQFYVQDGKLSCQLYQRSADAFLGVPFNIASYALLTMMIAKLTGLKPGEFIHTYGDAHIYINHIDQVKELLSRETRNLPNITITGAQSTIDEFRYEDFVLRDYNPHPAIKAPVAV